MRSLLLLSLLLLSLLLLSAFPSSARSEDSFVKSALAREIIGPRQTLLDLQTYFDGRIPRLGAFKTAAEWETYANGLRADILNKVVFRGKAAEWRTAKTQVELLENIEGGEGYRIRKLRYEALPGMWIPALLYEPTRPGDKMAVMLAVNGHDDKGKAAVYKQTRCINLAKRGMLVLNVEWFAMGQLKGAGYGHYSTNQLDLCGTSGIAPFYLAMTRGVDVLLSRPGADPARVAVSGLSGGGWQTIFVSSLDTRVTLANPVAGYSSFLVKYRDHFKDLGDSEQTPSDLARFADYTHLTALRAPRPTLLTFNSKDDCCFESGYALPPLLKAAEPIFQLYGKETALRSHVNDVPGTHNFEKDNRQALYRMVGDFFFPGDKSFSADEIPCDKEIKKYEDLVVDLPKGNADFNTLARGLARELPKDGALPTAKAGALPWQAGKRGLVRERVQPFDLKVTAADSTVLEKDGTKATFYKLELGGAWKVPVVELVRGKPKGTTILLDEAGRQALSDRAEELLKSGQRVLAVDPFYFGESKLPSHPFLFAILLASLGDRPLGLQAGELTAVAQWAAEKFETGPVTVEARGPRAGLIAVVSAVFAEKAIGRLDLYNSLGSLKEVIEQNHGVDKMPEMFCFGLLEAVDVPQLVALVAPRPVTLHEPSARAKKELAGLAAWYALLGSEHNPVP
jgi:hypothetical protein